MMLSSTISKAMRQTKVLEDLSVSRLLSMLPSSLRSFLCAVKDGNDEARFYAWNSL